MRSQQQKRQLSAAPRQVRIIGGQWKRTPLPVLEAEGLRPTPDRVRETVFNWLGHLLDRDWEHARCLDLFAGTGALGFEAASRGAAEVLMVESHSAAIRQLEVTKDKLKASQVQLKRGDAFALAQTLADSGLRFQVIFLDPPYHQNWLARMLPVCERLLVPGGLIYAESEVPLDEDTPLGGMARWSLVRSDRAGMVHYGLLQHKEV